MGSKSVLCQGLEASCPRALLQATTDERVVDLEEVVIQLLLQRWWVQTACVSGSTSSVICRTFLRSWVLPRRA
jgi:hypothetical protein